MSYIAYARTSTLDQSNSLRSQVERFKELGVDPDLIFSEQRSGGNADRPKLQEMLRTVRKGDVVVVTKLDRLARSMTDLMGILASIEKKGAGFKALDQTEIDTTKSTGRLVLGILASVAEFERSLIKERQAEGIRRAKVEGVKFGRDPKVTPEVASKITSMRSEGVLIRTIMAEFGLSKATVYRVLSVNESGGA